MIDVRRMTGADFDGVHALMEQIQALHVAGRPDIYRASDPLPREEFDYMLENDDGAAYVAADGGALVAFGYIYLRKPVDSPRMVARRTAFVDDLCVSEGRRGEGIGTKVLDMMKLWARAHGAVSLELMVWSFNADAIGFYEHEGMTERSVIMEQKL